MGCSSSRACGIHKKYKFGHYLGQGAYAHVRLCVKRDAAKDLRAKQDADTVCAVKILECGNKLSRADVRHECTLWKRVAGHRHVVDLLETFADERSVYFVMERCAYSLHDMMKQKGQLLESPFLVNVLEMLLALQHCHSVKVVHRDVKPANLLVSFDGTMKLSDFGLAELETEDGIVGHAGTAPFMSPEMLHGQRYNHKTDIWSLGATVYLMLYGDYPYKIRGGDPYLDKAPPSERDLMHQAIRTDSPRPTYVEENGLRKPSLEAREFVQTLLQRDPSARPSSNGCFCTRAMLTAYKVSRCVDPKKQKDSGHWDVQRSWTPELQDWLPADQIDGAEDIPDPTFEVTDVVEVIHQLQVRQSKRVLERAAATALIQRSEDPAEIKVNSAGTWSKDRTMSKSSIGSVSTADMSERSSSSSGQRSINSITSPYAQVELKVEILSHGIVRL